ncbi:MAG: hypothetical protein ACYC5O_14540 [Anaerolineae bacterium]
MQTLLYADDRVARAVLSDVLQRLGLTHRLVDSPDNLPARGLLLVAAQTLAEADWLRVQSYLRQGGRVAFLLPESHATQLLGSEEPLHYQMPYLKATSGPYSHLQVLSPLRLVRRHHGESLAHFCRDFSNTARSWATSYPAVALGEEGEGVWGLFLYDLARTVLAFHQGHPLFAGDGDLPDPIGDGKHRATHLIHGQVAAPLAEVPQAQGHEMLLLRLLRRLSEVVSPLPRLWPLPYPHTTAVVLSGDSDSLAAANLHLALDRLLEWGLPYTLYTMPDDLAKLSPADIDRYRERGIDFGLHYYHGYTPTSDEMRDGLTADEAAFAAAGLAPVSARGHSVIWRGWSEQAELLEGAGFAASSNFLGRLAYATGTGLPYRFISRNGASLGIDEVPIYAGDDVTLSDKWGLPPLPAQAALQRTLAALATAAGLYNEVLTFCFHPHYFSGTEPSTAEWVAGLGAACRERGYPVYNVAQWLSFWAGRRAGRLEHEVAAARGTLSLAGSAAGLGVALPRTWNGRTLQNRGIAVAGSDEVLLPAPVPTGTAAQSMEVEYA